NGLWARSDALGSITIANSSIVQYVNESPTFTFKFLNPFPLSQSILGFTISNGTNIVLTYATTPLATYHVESSANVWRASWVSLPGSTTNATGTSVSFTTPFSPTDRQRFFRVVSP